MTAWLSPVLFIEEGLVHWVYDDRWKTKCGVSFKHGQPMFNKHRRLLNGTVTCLTCIAMSPHLRY